MAVFDKLYMRVVMNAVRIDVRHITANPDLSIDEKLEQCDYRLKTAKQAFELHCAWREKEGKPRNGRYNGHYV
jgi:hypothetical protein